MDEPTPDRTTAQVRTTACILCSRNCGLRVELDGRRFARVRGDPQHPDSRGYLCQKAARLDHYQNHADRLRQPLKRAADGSFAPIGWDQALTEIAARLVAIRARHGGDAFAFVGGGGQGNHLGGGYGRQLLAAMGSRYAYNSLGQEKTGDFWVNGRLFGHQSCHTTEDIEHADVVLFIGCNPYQAHGIPRARDLLRDLARDPKRTMVVVDPRRTETAKLADVHLQLKPGTDAFLLAAMLAILVRDGLVDRAFVATHCTGADEVLAALSTVPIADFVCRADVPLPDVERVVRAFATAPRACVRVDLGTQHTLHTTLNAYLEKLLYLLAGKFGREGCNNLHTLFLPMLGHTDERRTIAGKPLQRTAHHGMHPIAGIYPPNILPDEILHPGEDRVRAVFVDSCNPLRSYTDTPAFERAFATLELLVVVDVAMTETARAAHYVLPAASQFEKWEATGFNLEFPDNSFHLRRPLLAPLDDALPEPEIYTRLLEKMGAIPQRFPVLAALARRSPPPPASHGALPAPTRQLPYLAAFAATLALRKRWRPFAASILYRSLGPALPDGAAAAAYLLPLAIQYATRHEAAVRRAGHDATVTKDASGPTEATGRAASTERRRSGLLDRVALGSALFADIVAGDSGVVLSRHEFADVWSLVRTPDRRIHLAITELLNELKALATEPPPAVSRPFILLAGERRSYNANQIYRDPAWRKVDHDGALRIHPDDAATLGMAEGERIACRSDHGEIEVVIEFDPGMRRGVVALPHGYGIDYDAQGVRGPEINRLTARDHCDPRTRTPYHKFVPVDLGKLATMP